MVRDCLLLSCRFFPACRDDGWWEVENADGVTGYVPSTFLKQYIKYRELMTEDTPDEGDPTSPRTGKQLWGGIRKVMREVSALMLIRSHAIRLFFISFMA